MSAAEVTRAPVSRQAVRQMLTAASPDLVRFLDAAAGKLGAKLVFVESGTLVAGRQPPWWQHDWSTSGEPDES